MTNWKKSIIATTALVLSLGAWAQFNSGFTPAALQQEIARQVAQGLKLDDILKAAQAAGIDVESFAVAAAKAGVPVASITTAVLTASTDPAASLKALGIAFAGDPAAVEAVFATAVTLPTLTLTPSTVEASIEAGCGKDCLPATVVAAVTATASSSTTAPTVDAGPTTTSSTTNSGGGSGGSSPISPAS